MMCVCGGGEGLQGVYPEGELFKMPNTDIAVNGEGSLGGWCGGGGGEGVTGCVSTVRYNYVFS